ncbi:Aste57867_14256 [Aphanomyces stellatus]|uniref:Aste57867_14256 protein n=1 Tax=Aphanomyces stellatus TaxID=120398 RepID=A0A485L2M7_9STRA|nr:hypothetical protein As57867_014205 [Aphanomyces stellatus]VFT91081.1 Aste57867_14256 [Aphanomyces stellatus]
MRCHFNHCNHESIPSSTKCHFHRKRSHCAASGCTNQSVANHLCVRHGGKRTCQMDGCGAPTRGRKKCPAHGGVAPKRYCSEADCTRQAHANHKCVAHGGGRFCNVTGCQFHIRSRGLCRVHLAAPEADQLPICPALSGASTTDMDTRLGLLPPKEIELLLDPAVTFIVDDMLASRVVSPQPGFDVVTI